MNAAARLVHQGVFTRYLVFTYLLTRKQLAVMLLSLAVLLSALGMIYVTHTTREWHASYQQQVAQHHRLLVEQSALLVERSTWIMQARLQQIAERQLNMIVPDARSVVILHE